MERSFTEDVKQLGYGAGQILHGEGILAITKAVLQSGVSYVGGYPGAPVSHLLDVMADANEPLLRPMGIYFEASGSEASAAALLGASINYPMRGAVTWKSVVGTNVASDALSHVASAGVIGGSVIVIGEDYGEGASILQERTHSTALKSSIPLLDPRNSLDSFARFVGEGFGLSEACNEPVFFSIRIRACHMRGTLRCRDNVRPAISTLSPLSAPSFSIDRINLPPFTYQMEAQKFEKRLPAARRYIVERRLTEHLRGDEDHLGIVMQGGLWNTTLRGLHVLGLADTRGRTPVPLLVLNAIHPLVPEELIDFLRDKRRVLVVEEGMPNYIERELKALAHEARLGVEIQGKELLSPHGEYVPHLVIGGLRRFFTSAGVKSQSTVAIEDRYRALTAHREKVGTVLAEPVAKRPPSFCTGCPERPVFSALKILRQREPEIGDTHVAADIGDGRRRLLAQRPHQRRGQRDVQPSGLGPGDPRQLLRGGDGPAPRAVDRQERAQRARADDDPGCPAGPWREVDPDREFLPHRRGDRDDARGADDARPRAQGRHRQERVHARAPASRAAPAATGSGRRSAGRPATLRRRSGRVHRRSLLYAPERLSVAHAPREPGSAA